MSEETSKVYRAICVWCKTPILATTEKALRETLKDHQGYCESRRESLGSIADPRSTSEIQEVNGHDLDLFLEG
jgi:hypothetical protein